MADCLDMNTSESMDSMDLTTLKRHPKNYDLTKSDLLQLLSQVEAELEAREIALAVLKSDKAKQLLYQAKYGRFSIGDPFVSLQRDSDCQKDQSFDEVSVKAMYDNQLVHLENLIATQRKAQQRMREQLISVEKRFHKVCSELDEEKRKHAQDTAQGDDVTYMLERDRERLKMDLEAEKVATKKVEKELKRTKLLLTEQQDISARHKQVAVVLIKERKALVKKLVEMDQANQSLEQATKEAASRGTDSQKTGLEATLERQLVEFDTEREQYRMRLAREESRNNELTADIERLSLHIEQLQLQMGMKRRTDNGSQSVDIRPLVDGAASRGLQAPAGPRVVQPGTTGAPPASPGSKNLVTFCGSTPPHTPPEMRRMTSDPHGASTYHGNAVATSSRLSGNQEYLLRQQAGTDFTGARLDGRPSVPAKPSGAIDPRIVAATAPPQPSANIKPSAARVNVHTEPSSNQVCKNLPTVARGNPPPVPPNKPQIGQVTQRLPPGEKPLPPPRFVGISSLPKDKSPKPSENGETHHPGDNVTGGDVGGGSRKPGPQVLVK